jgi:class 3 adenylate cyclase/PAS domain-containing protein
MPGYSPVSREWFERQNALVSRVIGFNSKSMSLFFVSQMDYATDAFAGRALVALDDILKNALDGTSATTVAVVGTVLCIICGFLSVPALLHLGAAVIWSLRLLLFCPPSVVLQTVPIQKVLSNDFSNVNERESDDSHFFESVVSHLLDAVVFLSTDLNVISANHAVESVLGMSFEAVVGKPLSSLFVSPDNSTSLSAFLGLVTAAMNCQRPPSIDADIEVLRDSKSITLSVHMLAITWSGHVATQPIGRQGLAILSLIIRDVTSAIAADKLLREEGVKSENLLLMILPPIIVKKLQSGEKNISFSVQSASILFLDIVSFTPWCGSHEAAYVMATLNRLFLEIDRLLKLRDRLTKIKCIGDCYMCAGGLFDTVHQPQLHAEQMVSFGLDIIHTLQLLNIELSETLRIRVGINTGGPLVAGVLGIDKPTFDILGPAICLAAAMEHHGVPMNVHIPQTTYDLVYDSHFIILERGNVEVKEKTYHTYLVTGYVSF